MNFLLKRTKSARPNLFRVMTLTLVTSVLLVIPIQAASHAASSVGASKRSVTQVATSLVNKMWTLAQNNDEAGLQTFINKAFQAQDADQPRWNKKQFINILVNKEDLSSYTLTRLRATRTGDTIVVTYTAAATQIVNGKELSGDPEPRLTVFVKSPKNDNYTVISHSSFNVPASS